MALAEILGVQFLVMRDGNAARFVGLATLLFSATTLAQPADGVAASTTEGVPPEKPAPTQAIGYAALPGGIHVPQAYTLPAGALQIGLLGGFGYRKGLLSADHTLKRGVGGVAASYGITDLISVGLSLDGRVDMHSPEDDGYVGDPHLFVRAGKALSDGGATIGAQLGLWVPGKDAPSIAGSAISVDARANASFPAGPGAFSVTAGFRLDNSAKSVDNAMMLSTFDRVSLGVSDYSAFLGGASYTVTKEKMWFGLEGSTDVFVGSGAPSPIFRGGLTAGFKLTDQFAALIFVEAAKVPGLSYGEVANNNAVVLIPYEPVFTGGLGFQARFGGPKAAAGSVTRNNQPNTVEVIEYAEASGEVVDDSGKPVIGARVTVKLKNNTGSAVTDDKGAWKVERLPIGKTVDGKTTLDDTGAEITVEVENKKPAKSTLVLAKGGNAVPKLALESMLPPGQLRGLVKNLSAGGKAIAGATVKIEPGGKTATTDAEGKFQIDLPPGAYKITVTSPGLHEQQLDVTIDPNGVAIKNIDLHK